VCGEDRREPRNAGVPLKGWSGADAHRNSEDEMSEHTFPVSDKKFLAEVLQSDLPVLVDFWAPWCGPCLRVAPILDELAREYRGRLRVAKVNTEEDQVQAGEYGIRGIPTMILFKNGNEVDRIVGAMPKLVMQLWLEESLAGLGEKRRKTA
jgi:thioredoxin 1